MLTAAYKMFIDMLKDMKDVVVSVLTFDQTPHLCFKEKTPSEILRVDQKLAFFGGDTNYALALAMVVDLLVHCSPVYTEHLGNILFFSDGRAECPIKEIADLAQMQAQGKTIFINTIACETEEDLDLIRIATGLKGNHYSTTSASALTQIFQKILSLT